MTKNKVAKICKTIFLLIKSFISKYCNVYHFKIASKIIAPKNIHKPLISFDSLKKENFRCILKSNCFVRGMEFLEAILNVLKLQIMMIVLSVKVKNYFI